MKMILFMTLFMICLSQSNPCSGQTQPRPAYLDEPVEVRAIGEIKTGEKYPLIIYLPFTTGSAETYFSIVTPYVGLNSYFAIIPKGTAQIEDYLPDFMAYLRWFEQRLMTDMQRIVKEYPVDTSKIYISGYSLGGDLSWALSFRQKELLAGALIIDSRCSYAPASKELKYLKEHKKRLIMLMGSDDLPERVTGMANSFKLAEKNGIAVWHWKFAGEHDIPGAADLTKAFQILFGRNDSGTAGALPESSIQFEMLQKH